MLWNSIAWYSLWPGNPGRDPVHPISWICNLRSQAEVTTQGSHVQPHSRIPQSLQHPPSDLKPLEDRQPQVAGLPGHECPQQGSDSFAFETNLVWRKFIFRREICFAFTEPKLSGYAKGAYARSKIYHVCTSIIKDLCPPWPFHCYSSVAWQQETRLRRED